MPGGLLGHVVGVLAGSATGMFALLGAGALLAATTQGPISTVVLLMEMTGRDRSFIAPLLLAVVTATLVARSIESRSVYDARLTDEEGEARRLFGVAGSAGWMIRVRRETVARSGCARGRSLLSGTLRYLEREGVLRVVRHAPEKWHHDRDYRSPTSPAPSPAGKPAWLDGNSFET